MHVESVIREALLECVESTGKELVGEITNDTVLLDSGLDSLGFAMLVARLEELLDYDPFTAMDEVVYPRTFGEFVAIYEKHKDHVGQT
jgi:hypothetical protein